MGDSAPARDVPLVLKGVEGRKRVVTAADELAQHIGVRKGMPITKAQALFSDLILMDADPVEDRAALERVAVWALRLSPIVAADPPDGLVLDTNGADHLQGGESNMLDAVLTRMADEGITTIGALADSWGAAHALARFGGKEKIVIPTGKTPDAILPLPLASLRLQPQLIESLHTLGFETVADLASQPRAPLTLRFGPELGRRLDQAFGRVNEPIQPTHEAEVIEARRVFAEPIGAPETLAKYTRKLVDQLCDRLEAAGLGARRLDLLFHRVDNKMEAVRIGTGRPSRDVKSLSRLLCDKIETVDPGFGIEVMSLTASLTEPLHGKQIVSSFGEAIKPEIGSFVDVISNRLGEKAVYRAAPVSSDLPERSVAKISPSEIVAGTWPISWPRPTRLLARPEPVEVMALLPDHPPVVFTWRGLRHRVAMADGPERVFGEWWKRDPELESVRDYFQVVDDTGKRFWIFRCGDGEHDDTGNQGWFMHGLFA